MRLLPPFVVLVGLVGAASVAQADKSVFVTKVSYQKAERAVARAHVKPGPRAFVLEQLKQAIATTSPGTRTTLTIESTRWGKLIAFAHGSGEGAHVTQLLLPKTRAGARAGVIVGAGKVFAGGVLTKKAGRGYLVDDKGAAQPVANDVAWGWVPER